MNTAAVIARSALARASSAAVTWLRPEDAGLPTTATAIVLDRPGRNGNAFRPPAVIEVADPAPVPTRERIRLRVRLYGAATPLADRPGGVRLRPQSIELEQNGVATRISPAELWAARPDVMAPHEGRFLGHLASAHPDVIAALVHRLPQPVVADRVVPVAIDSRGLVLRVERGAGHHDVRLDFAQPLTCPTGARDAVLALLDAPAKRPGLLAALLGAGPAAARMCSPER